MRRTFSLLLPFVACLCSAQPNMPGGNLVVSLRQFGVAEGLVHRHVTQMVEDGDGYVWLSTLGGVQRFDGNVFTTWTTAEGLSTNAIGSIWPDANGCFWLNSKSHNSEDMLTSIDIIDPRTGVVRPFAEHFGDAAPVPAQEIGTKAIRLHDGTLVMGVKGGLLFYGKTGFDRTPVKVEGMLRPVMRDREGAIWCFRYERQATFYDLVAVAPDGSLRTAQGSPFRTGIVGEVEGFDMTYGDRGLYFISEQTDSTTHEFWLSPKGELHRMPTKHAGRELDQLRGRLVVPLIDDRWLVNATVRRMQPGDDPSAAPVVHRLSEAFALKLQGLLRTFRDGRGDIWVAGDLGISQLRIRDSRFRHWLRSDNHVIGQGNSIRAMALVGDTLHVNSERHGTHAIHLPSGTISLGDMGRQDLRYALVTDGHDGLYGSHGHFLYHRHRDGTSHKIELPARMVWSILSMGDDRLLLGTTMGLDWIDTALTRADPIPEELLNMPGRTTVNHLLRDAQGHIWASTSTGLYQLDGDGSLVARWWIGSKDHQLPADVFHHLHIDTNGIHWLATASHGLLRWDRNAGNVQAITMRDGLPCNGIYATYTDRQGSLWLPTDRGIVRYDPGTGQVAIFNEDEGTTHHEFNRLAHLQGPDGTLYFGSLDGITVFHPDSLAATSGNGAAPFVLARVQQFDGGSGQLLDRTLDVADGAGITLLPDDRYFTLRMALLSYEDPANILYGWRIDGIDADWNLQREPLLRIAALPYGDHVLHLRAKGGDGAWNPMEWAIPIRAVRPWYLQWWAFALGGLLIAAMIYGLFRYRLARVRAMVRMRDRIALDLHDEVGSTLSSVALFSTVVNRRAADRSPEEGDMLRRIAENSAQAMESMNDIVWSVNSRYDDLGDVLDRMQQYAGPLAEAQDWDLHITMSDELRSMKLGMNERKNLYLVFKEAVNNAAKYARCDRMNISVARMGDLIVLSVVDNGVGLEAASSGGNGLGGNGLRSMEQRAADIRGILEVLSAPGQGTTITLRFRPQRG